MPNQESERLTLSVEEAAKILGIGRANCYESIRQGFIPSLRFGRRIVIPKAALMRKLEELGSDSSHP